uniref:Peptidase S1 domain-containing protein n=1 Tax=Anopheles coluzzii TaxID=1518534 RepID=A0A8W7Q1R2_ANOCL
MDRCFRPFGRSWTDDETHVYGIPRATIVQSRSLISHGVPRLGVEMSSKANYRWSRKYYDIAVVELEEYVKPNKAICVACLWREPTVPGDLMDAVGFGALGFGERLSSTLQKIQLQALDETICAKRLPAMRREMPEGLRDDQLCAHSATMDTCEGDSGGPLQTDRTDLLGKTYALIVGVVAFGTPCTNGSTGVYTRVSSYLDWIEEEVKESLSPEVCIEEDYCNRKMNPSVHGKVDKIWERSRVGLLWQDNETDIHQCGGLLVDYQFVITSASCIDHGGPVMKLFDKQQYFVHGIVSSLTQGCEGIESGYISGRMSDYVADCRKSANKDKQSKWKE